MDQFIGEIRLVGLTYAPSGWALCDGQLLPINQNQALFSLLGTNFGGDGKTNFALPDLRGRVPVGAGQGATGSSYAVGSIGGQETVKLTSSQLAPHAHAIRAQSGASTTKSPVGAFPAFGGAYAPTQDAKMNSAAAGRTGGGQPHENRQPYLTLSYIIALVGIWPTQN